MPSTFQLSPTHPTAHISALAMSTLGTAIGFYALRSPKQFATGWGLPSEANSPLWLTLAGRKITIGIVLITFGIQGKLKELGLGLMAGVITEGIDGYVTAKHGDVEKRWVSCPCPCIVILCSESMIEPLGICGNIWFFRCLAGLWYGVIGLSSTFRICLRNSMFPTFETGKGHDHVYYCSVPPRDYQLMSLLLLSRLSKSH